MTTGHHMTGPELKSAMQKRFGHLKLTRERMHQLAVTYGRDVTRCWYCEAEKLPGRIVCERHLAERMADRLAKRRARRALRRLK